MRKLTLIPSVVGFLVALALVTDLRAETFAQSVWGRPAYWKQFDWPASVNSPLFRSEQWKREWGASEKTKVWSRFYEMDGSSINARLISEEGKMHVALMLKATGRNSCEVAESDLMLAYGKGVNNDIDIPIYKDGDKFVAWKRYYEQWIDGKTSVTLWCIGAYSQDEPNKNIEASIVFKYIADDKILTPLIGLSCEMRSEQNDNIATSAEFVISEYSKSVMSANHNRQFNDVIIDDNHFEFSFTADKPTRFKENIYIDRRNGVLSANVVSENPSVLPSFSMKGKCEKADLAQRKF